MIDLSSEGCLATCHCGTVQLELAHRPAELTDCNCSICRRRGALWAYYEPEQVRLLRGSEALGVYCWQDQKLAFCHCQLCGCTTHYATTKRAERQRIAVNARMLPTEQLDAVSTRRFDGAKTWRYVDDD